MSNDAQGEGETCERQQNLQPFGAHVSPDNLSGTDNELPFKAGEIATEVRAFCADIARLCPALKFAPGSMEKSMLAAYLNPAALGVLPSGILGLFVDLSRLILGFGHSPVRTTSRAKVNQKLLGI